MGMLETIIAGVITAVLSSLAVEYVRELRKEGRQHLERFFDFIFQSLKRLIEFIRDILT